MFTKNGSEFFARQQKFVFVRPDVDINESTNLPDDPKDYIITDAEELADVGAPMDEDEEFEFWAVLEPGETI